MQEHRREYDSVGFLIDTWLRAAIVGFTQYSNRLPSIYMRTHGGQVASISTYAPHVVYTFESRYEFFAALGTFATIQQPHGPK